MEYKQSLFIPKILKCPKIPLRLFKLILEFCFLLESLPESYEKVMLMKIVVGA